MRTFTKITVICGVLIYSSPLISAEPERGQMLYENHCQSCHDSWVHTRAERQVTSISELQRRVSSWSIHIGLNWSNEEINDVTDYLSRHFYQLSDQP